MAQKPVGRTRQNREDAQLDNAYRKVAQPTRRTSKKKNTLNHRKGLIIAISAAAAILLVAIIAGCILLQTPDNGLIYTGVRVAGVDVGGMTKTDAINAVRLATNNTYTNNTMVIKIEAHSAELSPEITKAKLNVEAAVDAAYQYGRTGSKSEQATAQKNAQRYGHNVDLSGYLNLDTAAIRLSLNGLGSHFVGTLKQSTWNIVTENNAKVLVVAIGTPEYALDMEKLYNQVMECYSKNLFLLETNCPMAAPNAIDLESIFAEHCTAPVDAYWDEAKCIFVNEVNGFGFPLEETRKKLETAEYGSTVRIVFDEIIPAVTVDSLSKDMYSDILSSYTAANKASDANRNTNLALACKTINGLVIYPGETFSYNDTLGPQTSEKGYKPGTSYVNDSITKTIGGGVSQVSSTMYYCALQADLEIIERHNHYYTPNYIPRGMDAAVNWDSGLDFKFKNTSGHPIRIEASANGGTVTVRFLGVDDKDYYVKMEYKDLSVTPFGTTKKQLQENNPDGYRDGDVIEDGYIGYEVETYRCKYDKETDELISREKEESKFKYHMRNQVVCEIPNSGNSGSGSVSPDDGVLPEE